MLASKLSVECGIVRQHMDDVKSEESRKHLSIDSSLLDVLKVWTQTTEFSAPGDWMFASPAQQSQLPWSYPHELLLDPDWLTCRVEPCR